MAEKVETDIGAEVIKLFGGYKGVKQWLKRRTYHVTVGIAEYSALIYVSLNLKEWYQHNVDMSTPEGLLTFVGVTAVSITASMDSILRVGANESLYTYHFRGGKQRIDADIERTFKSLADPVEMVDNTFERDTTAYLKVLRID